MALKERDIKKATKATGKSYETKSAPKKTRDGSRTGAFHDSVSRIASETPSDWKAVVKGATRG